MQTESKKIKILTDTREQQPLKFERYQEYAEVTRDTLSYGDYTIVGHDQPTDDNSIIIERKKDCMELITNLGSKWNTFETEAIFLSKYKYKQIVVCSPNNFEILVRQGLTKLNINFIYRQLAYLYSYYGIATVFFPNRDEAENYMVRMFYMLRKKTYDEN